MSNNHFDSGMWQFLQAILNLSPIFLATKLKNPPPLVMVSRQADEALWVEVLNVDGYDVLTKPFDGEEVQRVMTVARRHGAGEQLALHA